MKKSAILIGIAGGSGSGKTSIAHKLLEEYGEGEVVVLQQDSYYKDLPHLPLEKRHQQNFDHPDSIDIDLLGKQLKQLLMGSSVEVPVYDFVRHRRRLPQQAIAPHSVVVLEGIFTLHYPELRQLMDIKIYVETPSDVRFIRRLTRDVTERKRTHQSVIDQYLKTVRPMHEQFVEPSKYYADIIIPEGGENKVAIDLFRTKINAILWGVNYDLDTT
ncbi:uridine kinase [Candidatus Neomarinimicrobiota bacterium]